MICLGATLRSTDYVVDACEHADCFAGESVISALVARRVMEQPEECALRDTTGRSLTYAELWERAGWMAAALAEAGVAPGDLVALAVERSVELPVAALGVLRAGAAYVPLDPAVPEERLRTVVEDCAPRAVVRGPGTRWMPPAGPAVVALPDAAPASRPPAPARTDAGKPMFVGYTSGSTGRPKGVVISHRAVASYVRSSHYCPLGPGDRVAGLSSPAFDITTFEIWNTLVAGATLVVLPDPASIPVQAWDGLLREHRITAMLLTTALFDMIAREDPTAFRSVDTLLFGGEQADAVTIRRVCEAEPPRRLVNAYGPTEATTMVSAFVCTAQSTAEVTRVPIGFPIQPGTLHVLDADARPVPTGEDGELCVSGPQLATEYLGDPALTARKFVTLPGGEHVYRTGDLVRCRPDGALEFLGRIDRQIKLRGFRIEPEEVELALMATGMASAVAVEKTGEGARAGLVAYVRPAAGAAAQADDLTDRLAAAVREALPAYMVPGRWIVMAEMPMHVNGKIDRGRLPEPGSADGTPTPGDAVPADGDENDPLTAVRAVVADLLQLPGVGPDENFLDLGGNSILAMQATARLRDRFGVELNPADLLFADSMAEFACLLAAQLAELPA